jgi:hypothetical protein
MWLQGILFKAGSASDSNKVKHKVAIIPTLSDYKSNDRAFMRVYPQKTNLVSSQVWQIEISVFLELCTILAVSKKS